MRHNKVPFLTEDPHTDPVPGATLFQKYFSKITKFPNILIRPLNLKCAKSNFPNIASNMTLTQENES
jgi:hypothetical protein